MTREEQIKQAAINASEKDICNAYSFCVGAAWADRNPVLTKQVDDDGLSVVIHCKDEHQAKVVASLVAKSLSDWMV